MARMFRSAIVLFTAVGIQRSIASRPKEESSSIEVTLDAVAALLDADNKKSYLAKAGEELAEKEVLLKSLLAIVPGSNGDRFSAPAARFALHKHFVRHYGWHLKGLEPAGAAWNSSSPVQAVIFQRLPASVRSLFESRLKDGGLLGREVAVLAATLELLVHAEARERLRGVMRMLNLRTNESMTEGEAHKVRDWYMTSYMLGKSPWTTSRLDLKGLVVEMPNMYPAWPKVTGMIDDIMSKRRQVEHRAGGDVAYDEVAGVVEEIGHRFGPWQNQICSDLKSSLMEVRDDGTGRVALSDFYHAGLNGKWQFQESAEYMQKLGSLDVSTPSSPRVIIPNYVWSASNCMGASETHDVCCISECEPLMAQLEREIGAPTALPAQIAEVVSNLPSSTMPAGRQLPALLMSRLQAVAAANEGVVPLNGRLFAQWLHHAYPRECPFPHVAGATAPVNVFAWEASHHDLPLADPSAMSKLADQSHRSDAPVLSAPWDNEEELLVDTQHSIPVGAVFVHLACAGAASCVAVLGLMRTAMHAARKVRGSVSAKSLMTENALVV